MSDPILFRIETDFSEIPGARYRENGDASGEEFYEDYLLPAFNEALEKHKKLHIDLDGTWGYASSFLSESFGRLSKEKGADVLHQTLVFISKEEPELVEYINGIIDFPNQQRPLID